MKQKPIYLDYNATTPIDPVVIQAMRPFLEEHFGNPSSSHWYGVRTKTAIEQARRQVADALGCQVDEVIFTSGGSESNNYAIKGIASSRRNRGNHIITSAIEHPAVLEVCRFLAQNGFDITYVPVDADGLVAPDQVRQAIRPSTILITIMQANNEVGTIQPIAEIGKIAREHDIVFHTDAAQSIGKIPCRIPDLHVDLLSIAAHKFYAPKGIGALYLRRGLVLEKHIHGASHEQNRRAGTENVLEIVGIGQAIELASQNLADNSAHMQRLRDRLHHGLLAELGPLHLNGHPELRLPNTLSLSFAGIEANLILSEIGTQVAASAGAACHADTIEVSHVLTAMAVPIETAMGTIRFSTGKFTTDAEIDQAIPVIARAIQRLRPEHSLQVPVLVDLANIKLTHFTSGLGCACKLRPQALEKILAQLPVSADANVLVGTQTSDDAAVYRLDSATAIVQTVDFFTPIVDDPYHFGAISAANSLSDIYAMGATPLFGLNIVGFPSNRLPMAVLDQILHGALDKAAEAGIAIIGGHTIDDSEPKYGLAVTGVVDPGKVLRNSTAQPGDALILTKSLGTGIITTAIKRGLADPDTERRAIASMSTLNRAAAEVMRQFPVQACTDVTGFGLLGHLHEMTQGSGVDAVIDHSRVPILGQALELAAAGIVPGGTSNNLDFVQPFVVWDTGVAQVMRLLLCDAQTSGGLLIAVSEAQQEALVVQLHQAGVSEATKIGVCTESGEGKIRVL